MSNGITIEPNGLPGDPKELTVNLVRGGNHHHQSVRRALKLRALSRFCTGARWAESAQRTGRHSGGLLRRSREASKPAAAAAAARLASYLLRRSRSSVRAQHRCS